MNRRHLLSLLGGTAISPLLPKVVIAEESVALEPVVKLETEKYLRILISADGGSFINMMTGQFVISGGSDQAVIDTHEEVTHLIGLRPNTEYQIKARIIDNPIDWEVDRD